MVETVGIEQQIRQLCLTLGSANDHNSSVEQKQIPVVVVARGSAPYVSRVSTVEYRRPR